MIREFFLIRYAPEILQRTGEHLILVFLAISVATLVGIPLGILITRKPNLKKPILGFANIVQTIPSLAIFGFLISVPLIGGIGARTAIIALTLYSLLPIIRNTYTGITGVDPAIREAGRGMGMTDWQLLFQVEIPLALGVILAGVRVATAIAVGVATVAAAIGAGGLGLFIFQGISTVNNQLVLAGAIPAALMALVADLALGWIEHRLTLREGKRQKLFPLVLLILPAICIVAIAGCAVYTLLGGDRIVIGSKNYTEQVILGEFLAQHIEARTNLKVDRRLNLGGTGICHEGVKSGELDAYVEYTGTSFTEILKQKPINDPQAVYKYVKQAYSEQFGLEVTEPLGFNNTFAIIVRGEDARRLNIQTISQAAKYTPQWRAGFGYEFVQREDGFRGLAKTYGLKFAAPPQVMELGLVYKAIAEKKVDMVAGDSTAGLIAKLDLVVLKDDKNYFPPYEAVPVVRQQTLEKYPKLREVFANLGGLISEEEMRRLNYQIDGGSPRVEQVVREFRKSKGL